jgi:uncharacterized membrane protein
MVALTLHQILLYIQHGISFLGVLLILSGVLIAMSEYVKHFFSKQKKIQQDPFINRIRLNLGRTLILGLEFIVAADLIGTTTAPDYYSVGIVASIVLIRTLLSFSLNKEINDLTKEEAQFKN